MLAMAGNLCYDNCNKELLVFKVAQLENPQKGALWVFLWLIAAFAFPV